MVTRKMAAREVVVKPPSRRAAVSANPSDWQASRVGATNGQEAALQGRKCPFGNLHEIACGGLVAWLACVD